MKAGKVEAKNYISRMRSVIGVHLIDPDSIYAGKEGHLRFARECGYALNDFNEAGKLEILKGSYSSIYVIGCNLNPILDASEWIKEMKTQIKG